MPSEPEAHVARSFLTKIFRSSTRKNRFKWKNDLKMRPQSWHSSKPTEESEDPREVWRCNHDSSIKRSVIQGHRSLTHRTEKEDRVKQPGCLDPAGHSRNVDQSSTPESKKDSGFSCLPGGSSSNRTSSENIFFKGLPNEAPPPPDQQSSRGNRIWEKGTSKLSLGYTPVVGPVRQTPGKDNQTSASPPTSPCTDSHNGTKVFPYCKGIGGSRGIHARSVDMLTETNRHTGFSEFQERRLEARRSFNPLPCDGFLHPDMAVNRHKHLSLSSSDVSVEGFHRSLRDLPSNAPIQRPARHSTAAASADANPALGDALRSMHTGMAKEHLSFEFQHAGVDKCHNITRLHNKGRARLHNEHPGLERSTKMVGPVGAAADFLDLRKVLTHQTFGENIHFSTPIDPWVPRENHRRSPQKMQQQYLTAQENRSLLQNHSSPQDRGNETGYATPHRNQVRQKKLAQLQRSRSAAILTGHVEEEEEEEQWSSTLTYNSSTYKDNLKEAQARVLQATSFQRRDLEPVGPFRTSAQHTPSSKRSFLARRTHSFSEPDKIHRVGVEGDPHTVCFRECRKYLEVRPQFSRPVLRTSKNTDTAEESDLMSKYKGNCASGTAYRNSLSLRCEQKRVGTFSACYSTWSQQRESCGAETPGRFHSAENILDAESIADWNSPNRPAECRATDWCPTPAGQRTTPEPGHRDTVEASMVVPTPEPSPGLEFSAAMDGPPVLDEKEGPPPSPQVQLVLQDPGPGLSLSVKDRRREDHVGDVTGEGQSLADALDRSGGKATVDQLGEEVPTHSWASGAPKLLTVPRGEEDSLATPVSSLVPSSSYYNTSAPKAELLIKMKDMPVEAQEEQDVDLADKKYELILSLEKKLQVLQEARRSLQEDVEDNEALGRQVDASVQRFCLSNQLERFRMFIGDLDKVVSLLLSLSGRLARVDNALDSLDDEESLEEKRTLTEKRKLLMRQHEDAKELKENLDRRERVVSAIMADHLDSTSLEDYRYFIKMKSALIIEQRRLEDKIKLGEEQLACLLESLPPERRPTASLSMSLPEGGDILHEHSTKLH
ncbi:protein Shroom2-like [Neosynchiropus ocellatus]